MIEYFDPNDKNNRPILDYFQDKTWLLVDTSSSTRASIRKIISKLGSKSNSVFDADTIESARSIIETKKPNIVVVNKTVRGESTIPLYECHIKNVPNRIDGSFYAVTEENSLSEVAWVLEYEMDGIISRPLNGTTMICTFINGILKKIEPSYYQQKLEEGRVYYYQNKSIEALETLKTTKSLHQNPYESCSLIAQIYKDKNEITTAINSYEESISFNQFYFKALKRLSDLYYQQKNFKKSYEITQAMTSHYPISPERIPDLIRLSIINKKYEDIINYFKIFKTIQSPNLEMQQFLSAAMAILGKYFTQTNDTPRAIEALQAAYKFSNGKYEILKSVTQSFQELNKVEILLEMFDKTDLSKWSLEVQGLYFLTLHLTSQDDQHIILVGEKMLKNQVVDFNIYKGVIERSIKIKRSKSNILILISEAIKYFPEHALEFENLKDTLPT